LQSAKNWRETTLNFETKQFSNYFFSFLRIHIISIPKMR